MFHLTRFLHDFLWSKNSSQAFDYKWRIFRWSNDRRTLWIQPQPTPPPGITHKSNEEAFGRVFQHELNNHSLANLSTSFHRWFHDAPQKITPQQNEGLAKRWKATEHFLMRSLKKNLQKYMFSTQLGNPNISWSSCMSRKKLYDIYIVLIYLNPPEHFTNVCPHFIISLNAKGS